MALRVFLGFLIATVIPLTKGETLSSVLLTSDLIEGNIVTDGHVVTFTCTILGGSFLTWSSDEYIGTNGLPLSFADAVGFNVSSSGSVATLLSATPHVNGGYVIQSRLQFRASLSSPMATVTCRNNSHGLMNSTSFHVIPPSVLLTSDLIEGNIATDGHVVTFTCTILGGSFLTWSSDEYIGTNGLPLSFADAVGFNVSSSGSVATLLSATPHVNGGYVIQSQLQFRASLSLPMATVTCRNNSHGLMNSTNFQVIASPHATTQSMVTRGGLTDDNTSTEVTKGGPHNQEYNIQGFHLVIVIVVFSVAITVIIIVICLIILCRKRIFRRRPLRREITVDNPVFEPQN